MTTIEDLTRRLEIVEAALFNLRRPPTERVRLCTASEEVLSRMRDRGVHFPSGTRVMIRHVAEQLGLPHDKLHSNAIGSVLRTIGMEQFRSNGHRWFRMR